MQNGPQELPQIKPIELYTNFETRNYPRGEVGRLAPDSLVPGSYSDGCFGGEVCQRREVER